MRIAIVVGIIYGLLLCLIGVGFAGGGHGWNGALLFGALSLVTTPWAIEISFGRVANNWGMFILFGVILGIIDLLMLWSIWQDFHRIGYGGYFWLLLWSAPQVLVLAKSRKFRA